MHFGGTLIVRARCPHRHLQGICVLLVLEVSSLIVSIVVSKQVSASITAHDDSDVLPRDEFKPPCHPSAAVLLICR
ncbi:hypothetical protein F5890DRAFT_1211318 [Lentinula detonsa]|uniref:Uncharacterized protein n=1 Tax=Lentinula detonsa TaxID=2804962 RepID=A0AA38UUS9_9AGAR|nr:hypothetical protein F5890DRAFT_1211318 [Lentinula detonsa]